MPKPPEPSPGIRARIGSLDKLLEHRSRLGACVALARGGDVAFTRLRELLQETDGNLGAHLRKLEDAGYIRAIKQFVERKPVTWYRLTPAGRRALAAHLGALEALIGEARAEGADA